MKIDRHNIFNIIDNANKKFIDQPSRMYWKEDDKEVNYEEKRIIAIVEAVSIELKLDVEVECESKH